MKKIKWLLAALPLMVFAAACTDSSDEPIPQTPKVQNEITFAPTFDRASRSASLYDSNNKPQDFVVGAFHIDSVGDRKPFFLGDKYVKQDGQWVNTSGTRYWPDGGSTDFYAFVVEDKTPGNDSIQWNDMVLNLSQHKTLNLPSPYLPLYTINSDARQQYDLLYATVKDQHRSTNPVPLNFRHALTQVVFDAMNVSKNIYVEISGISVENINMHMALQAPNKSTTAATSSDDDTYGVMTPITKGYNRSNSYATFPTVGLAGNSDESAAATPLTSADPSLAMLLSPAQSGEGSYTDPLHRNAYATDTKFVFPYQPNPSSPMQGKGGQALKVNCTIWEVKNPDKGHDASVDVELWGDKGGAPKELIVPVDITNWEPGKRFIYTLVFGKGSAGYDPSTDTPVLTPITYNVTVDDFIDMKTTVNP